MKLTEGQLLFRLQDFQGAEQEALGIGDYELAQESADIANALRELLQARRTIEELTSVVEQRNGECVRLHSELESRTVTIEPFRSFVTDADLAALHRFAECCDDPESGGHDLEKEQVLRLEAIGALRRYGCVHWITGFGDVLISITAGIKWEAE